MIDNETIGQTWTRRNDAWTNPTRDEVERVKRELRETDERWRAIRPTLSGCRSRVTRRTTAS